MIGRLGELGRRLWYLLNRSRFDRELRDEMDAHRAMASMKGEGGPRFGNELRLREEAADAWGWTWCERLVQDVRFGVRLLWRAPGFSGTAIAVLAIGIGMNLAAFQVFDAVALSWLPVRSPETLVKLTRRTAHGTGTSFSYPEFAFYRARSTSLAGAFALVYGRVTIGNADVGGDAEFVSATYFSDLGARPIAGRLFDGEDERSGAPPVVVVAQGFWNAKLGGDPTLIGRPIRINGHPFTLAGIVPSAFLGFEDRQTVAWIPVTQHGAAFDGSTLLQDWAPRGAVRFYARLRGADGMQAAEAELAPLAAALHDLNPADSEKGEWVQLHPAGHYLALEAVNPGALAMVTALVLLVLVAACMNLGVLVLARTVGRDREFAVRLSVGASRGRILRQLLTEHLVLGGIGAAAGCVVGAVASRALAALIDMPAGVAPHFTVRSALLAAALATGSSLVFGFTPAMQTMRPAASRRLRLRSVLVGVQVAAAGVLLIVSGLLVRGVTRIIRVPLGFDYRQALIADPSLAAHGMKPAAAEGYWRRFDSRVRQVPGVLDAALTTLPPFGNRVAINAERTVFYSVTASYFDTLRIPIERGRVFRDGEQGVAVVSRTLARRRWGLGEPLGETYDGKTVIGVAGDARTVRVGETASAECYSAIKPGELPNAVMVLRVGGPPRGAAGAIAALARDEGPGLTPEVLPLADALEARLDAPRQAAKAVSILGMSALLLAVTGLGGMIAYTVSQRAREIGVRVALGARPSHIIAAIARQFVWPIAGGAAAGSVAATGVATMLSRELFGVSAVDPWAHGGALLLFALVSVVVAAPSIRRALRVDPITTLRAE